jgi:hypothetical protein
MAKGMLLILMLLLLPLFAVNAQNNASEKNNWHFLAEPYLMFPHMKGDIGAGDQVTVPVDANTGEILGKLKMGAMLFLEARTSRWAITSDFLYMKLGQEVIPSILLNSGNISASQLMWEPAGLYRILPFFEFGAGGRLNNMQTDIDVRRNVFPVGTEQIIESVSKTWFDPIIITRLSADINEKWLFQFRGDIGGFGIGSDFTWQVQASAGYRFSKLFQLTAGYRYISVNYDKGEGSTRFIYDINTYGPVVRFGFNF